MCIIIASPAGTTIPLEHIENSSQLNSDGIGMSYREGNGQVTCVKSLVVTDFITQHGHIIADDTIEKVVHLRLATHGSVKLDNVHPFRTQHGYYLHHNGIFSIKTKPHEVDSVVWMKRYVDTQKREHLFTQGFREYVESGPLEHSKVVLHTDRGFMILGEERGHWKDGIWYSCHAYQDYKDTGWYKPIKGFASYFDDDPILVDYDPMESVIAYLDENLPHIGDELTRNRVIDTVQEYLYLWYEQEGLM